MCARSAPVGQEDHVGSGVEPQTLLWFLAGLVGFGTFIAGLLNSRNAAFDKSRDDRFREADVLAENALQEAEHLRQRIQEVRAERDEIRRQLAEERAKGERKDIRIAQLKARETQLNRRLSDMETENRALRRLLAQKGINDAEADNA